MKREQIVLLGALVILGLMGWGLSEGPASPRLRLGVRTIEVFEAGANHPVVDFSVTGNRDPFREPREVEPLPPLTLPLPPLGELESLLPPPVPDAGANEWSRHLLVVPAQLPGSIDDLIGMDEGDPQSVDSDLIDTSDGQSLVGEEDLARQWDQVRTDALTIRWGRLLGGERWDWESGKDSIHFQEVDPETGLDRFAPYVLAPDAYQSFAFADTLRNRMELGLRKLPVSAGAIPERLAFVAWLLEQGDREPIAFELAETLARSNIQLAEDDAKTWLSLGAVFERTFQFDEAFAVYASMVGLPGAPSPDLAIPSGRFARTSAAQVRLGGLLETLGLDQEAEARYRDAWQLADGDPASGHALGSLLHRTGRCDEAVDILKRAEGMYPSRSADGALQHQVSLGQALLGQGEFAEAQRVFAALQRSAGESKSAVMGRSGEAAAAYLAGDFEVALDLAREGVDALGSDWRLLMLRGLAGGAQGEPAGEVIRDLRAAATAAGLDAAPAYAAQAFWLHRLGHLSEAQGALDRAFELAPTYPYALYLRARWARIDLDFESAKRDLHDLLAVAPQCAAVLGELGWLLNQEGRLPVAEVAFRRAVVELPGWMEIHLRRGLNLLSMGDLEEARAALTQVGGAASYAKANALAWLAYLEGDLANAVGEFALLQDNLQGQPDHPQAVFAKAWQERISQHALLVRWVDGFEGTMPRPQWDIRNGASLGVEPKVLDGRLMLRGNHSKAGETRASRALRALDFRSGEATFEVGPSHRGSAGVSIALETRRRRTWEFKVFRTPEGAMRWSTTAGAQEEVGELNLRLAPGSPAKVKFSLDREQSPPVLTVEVQGQTVWSDDVPRLRTPTGDLVVAVHARTVNALPVDVSLDDVDLIYTLSE